MGIILDSFYWTHSRRTSDNEKSPELNLRIREQYANMATLRKGEGKQLVFCVCVFFNKLDHSY